MAGPGLQQRLNERFVRNYDRLVAPLERRVFSVPRAELVSSARGRVLDLGAGTGANFALYGNGAGLVAAVDPEPGMLAQARPRAASSRARIALVTAEGETLPFADNSFDIAIATLVFCTVRDPGCVLDELRRVLVPGGRLYALEHVRSTWGPLGLMQDLATPLNRRIAGGCNLNRRTPASIEKAGFIIGEIRKRLAGLVVEIRASAP